MRLKRLGTSAIRVSIFGLGTMTFGEQNSEAEAHLLLDCALASGISLIDTAEMYPVPPRRETYGLSERHIGSWLRLRQCREKVVLASKVVGPTTGSRVLAGYIRDGVNRLSTANLKQALDKTLLRLKTDYLDLYQVHWPNREPLNGKPGDEPDDAKAGIMETQEALEQFRKSGKIRGYGISNETPWGVMKYLSNADFRGWERPASIQNPYNLLNRAFEPGLAEICARESLGMIAYSPLGSGMLTGKYLDGAMPARGRLTRFSHFKRYHTLNSEKATKMYAELAEEHGLEPAQMALAFNASRPFITCTLLGATSIEQLQYNAAAHEVRLTDEILQGIQSIHQRFTNPANKQSAPV